MSSPAYVTAQVVIHDSERYGAYAERFASTLAPFDGTLLAADGAPTVLEGDWPHEKFVLIRFPSSDAAGRWAASPAYREISVDREAATTTVAVLLRGVA